MDQRSNYNHVTDHEPQHPDVKPTHSKAGIASLVIGIIAWVMGIITLNAARPAFMEIAKSIDPMDPVFDENQVIEWVETYPVLIAVIPSTMAIGGLTFLGVVLGIVSLFSRNRIKTFPILGTIVNAIPIVGFLIIFAIGQTLL